MCPIFSIIQLMTGNIKPHYFVSCSLDVVIVGDDDGLDARAQALPSPGDVGHIQCLSRSHDACLEQLRARMEDDLDSSCRTLHSLLSSGLRLGERGDCISFRRPAELIAWMVVALWADALSCKKP